MTEDRSIEFYVVVADEDLEEQALIKEALKQCDLKHIMTSVYNGEQLINLLLKRGFYKTDSLRTPDLIIIDLKMQVLNGMDALLQIKQHEKLHHIPVYVITDCKLFAQKSEALKAGALGCFDKPLQLEELKKMILSMCDTLK